MIRTKGVVIRLRLASRTAFSPRIGCEGSLHKGLVDIIIVVVGWLVVKARGSGGVVAWTVLGVGMIAVASSM